MKRKLAEVQLNDRVILPPFDEHARYWFRTVQRRTARRVLAIEHGEEGTTITLDGCEPKTLPGDIDVIVYA